MIKNRPDYWIESLIVRGLEGGRKVGIITTPEGNLQDNTDQGAENMTIEEGEKDSHLQFLQGVEEVSQDKNFIRKSRGANIEEPPPTTRALVQKEATVTPEVSGRIIRLIKKIIDKVINRFRMIERRII